MKIDPVTPITLITLIKSITIVTLITFTLKKRIFAPYSQFEQVEQGFELYPWRGGLGGISLPNSLSFARCES